MQEAHRLRSTPTQRTRGHMAIGGNSNELACVYAALILHDDGLEISSDNIALILKAANIEVEPYWPTLFAKLCKGKSMRCRGH